MPNHPKADETDTTSHQTKLSLEIKKLQQDTSWQTRFTTALWPIVAALFTGYVTFATYFLQKSQKHTELLNQAFVNATDSEDTPASEARRIAATWQLNQFWQMHDEQDEIVIPPFLVAELSIKGGGNQNVRCAAVAAIGNLFSDKYVEAVGEKRFERVRRLLFGDKDGAIGQLVRMNVLLKLETQDSNPVQECDNSLSVGPLDATREAIRLNWNYLRRANLQGADLNGVRLYDADLAYASLKNVNLSGASFYCANLYGANFEGSNLAGTDFTYANVRGATFPKDYKMPDVPTLGLEDSEWLGWRKQNFDPQYPGLKDQNSKKTTLPLSCDSMNEDFVGRRRPKLK